ncbi:MAG: hypothetical protein EBZ74_08270, partial [Planctomycetia bacterium]|nr:hypothetical protein [Planctomycetia bacterium]
PADADHGGDAKIMGSAQRRLAAAVMQHGSLLLERNRGVPGEASHPGLRELTRNRLSPADARPLAERWLRVVADSLAMKLVAEEGPFAPEALVRERARRFADCRWTGRR